MLPVPSVTECPVRNENGKSVIKQVLLNIERHMIPFWKALLKPNYILATSKQIRVF